MQQPTTGDSPEFRQFCSMFIVIGTVGLLLLLAAIFNTAPIGTDTTTPPPPEFEFPGSNVFEGYGDTAEAGNANIRRAEDNEFITSETVDDLELKCKVDIAALYNETFLFGYRFNQGRYGVVQVSETHSYITIGVPDTVNLSKQSKIVAINRETCEIDAVVNITDINTQAVKLIAQKYPGEYNLAEVDAFQRSVDDGLCFSPIVLFGNRIITGDGCIDPNFFRAPYYDSLPQANGGPILGKSWGITNDNRHLLAGNLYVLDATTLELLDADRVADAGEAAAFGNCNVNGIVGVPQVVADEEVDEANYIFVGTHTPTIYDAYTRLDRISARMTIGKLNGNRPTSRNTFKRFHLYDNGTVSETWRIYDTPEPLMGGDQHPMNASVILANDTVADELNYYGSGFAYSALVDLERRQAVVTGGTAFVMPKEAAIAAFLATGTGNPQTGGFGYPNRTHTDWTRLFAAATTSAEQHSIYADFVQTQVDRETAVRLYVNTDRYDAFLADCLAVVDIDTGTIKWTKRRVATNSDASEFLFEFYLGVDFDSEEYIKAQYLGASGDHDWNLSPVHVIGEYGPDFYALGAKDGSIQIFDPDTGAVASDTKVLTGQWTGSINTGGTIDDGGNVYFSGQWYRTLNYLSDLSHITTFNETTSEITFEDNPNCPILDGPSACVDSDYDWYSNAFIDTFDDLLNGAGAIYLNQDIAMPEGVGLLLKSPVPYAANVLAVTRDPPGQRTVGGVSMDPPLLGEAVLTSVNDVLIATNQFGTIQLWDATTMEPIRVLDLLPDVAVLPGHPGALSCSNGVAIAGKEIWFACGDISLNGSGPGAFVYSYSV